MQDKFFKQFYSNPKDKTWDHRTRVTSTPHLPLLSTSIQSFYPYPALKFYLFIHCVETPTIEHALSTHKIVAVVDAST